MEISGLVITFNEETWIGGCVEDMFRVCDEVIVIDSYSKDRTVEIAKEKGAKVIQQEFLGDGPQRIYGLQFCKNNWILNLDADERLEEDSYQFIKSGKFFEDIYDGYRFRRNTYFRDELINFSGWYPDYACRFFDKRTAKPETTIVHQDVKGKNILKSKMHLRHYSWNSFNQIISKKNQYTDWQVQEYVEKGKKASSFAPLIHGWVSFFKCYIFKKGIFHGLDGFTFALIQAFFSYMKYAKLIKENKKK